MSPAWLGILSGQSPELDTPLLRQVGDSQQLGGPHGPPRRSDYNSQRPRHVPLCLAILPAQPCNLMQSASFCPICALPHLPPEPCLQHDSASAAGLGQRCRPLRLACCREYSFSVESCCALADLLCRQGCRYQDYAVPYEVLDCYHGSSGELALCWMSMWITTTPENRFLTPQTMLCCSLFTVVHTGALHTTTPKDPPPSRGMGTAS